MELVVHPDNDEALASAQEQIRALEARVKELTRVESATQKEVAAVRQKLDTYASELEFALRLERSRATELEQAYFDMVLRLTRASVYRDRETGAHIQRVSYYARTIARTIGWSEEQQELIFRAAPMHDLGKIAIPDMLLRKRGALNPEDRLVMENHTRIGAQILEGSNSRLLQMARDIAISHHEHWDGSGYPQGLRGEAIPLAGRIVMLGDNYDALRSSRSYKQGFSHERACLIILEGDLRTRPEHFDPQLLSVFREIHPEFNEIFERLRDETWLTELDAVPPFGG